MQKLFTPFRINSLELKNRIIMPCLDSTFAGDRGRVNPRLLGYYAARARGGAAFILIGPSTFEALGAGYKSDYRLDKEDVRKGLVEILEKIHGCGIPAGIQMYHAGRQADPGVTGGDMVAPSAVADPVRKIVPRELRTEEIERLIHLFGVNAGWAKEAGFNAIELHCSHGYLLAEFLSRSANHREDSYGGSIENRARLPMQIISEIRRAVGPEFPIIVRLAGNEHVEGGISREESPVIASFLEYAGADAINVSAGTYKSAEWIVPPAFLPRACNLEDAAAIKESVNIPVIVAGRINSPELAEEILEAGRVDAVAMGRPLVADPELPRKACKGKSSHIRRCIGCNLCVDKLFKGETLMCTVNPEVGHENDFIPDHARKRKRVMIVGGGPGGMEAARTAALRGHSVSLYEQGSALGGQLIAASKAPFKEEIKNIIDYYTAVLSELLIEIHLGFKVTSEKAAESNADAVIVATGAAAFVPDIQGRDLPRVVQARDLLLGNESVSGEVSIIGGGNLGCEVSLYLAEKGLRVNVFEQLPYVAYGIPRLAGKMMKSNMRERGVTILTNSEVQRITREGVVSRGPEKAETLYRSDYVVMAAGSVSCNEIFREIQGKGREVRLIGDALEPRSAAQAIYEGARAGLLL